MGMHYLHLFQTENIAPLVPNDRKPCVFTLCNKSGRGTKLMLYIYKCRLNNTDPLAFQIYQTTFEA